MVLVEKPIKYIDRVEHEFGRLDFIVPGIVIDELKRLAEKAGPKRAMMAKTAIQIIQTKFQKVQIPIAAHVDDAIVEFATQNKCAVATIDTNLRRRLIANEVLVLTLSRDRLVVANPNLN
jgi:rRNA-processing protein FCF1